MSETLKQRKLVLNILWGAMVWVIFIYYIIYGMISRTVRPMAGPASLWYAMTVAATVPLLAGWIWHTWRIGQINALITPTTFSRLSPAERMNLQAQMLVSAIVSLAFFEATAMIGLVLGMLGCPIPNIFHTLAAASLLCIVMYRIQGYHEIFGIMDKLDVRAPGT